MRKIERLPAAIRGIASCNAIAKLTLLAALGLFSISAHAQNPPPALPLPPCEIVDGEETGACLDTDDAVSGTAGGEFSEGSTLQISTVPSDGICVFHDGFSGTNEWSPSPCFASVQSPTLGICGVIDLFDDETFKEMPCSEAFYDETVSFSGSLFSVEDGDGNRCGDSGNFQTYYYGGPANVAGARWSEYGPASLNCNVTFNGPRPNALFGPTWVKMSVGLGIAVTGDGRSPGSSASTEFYVPVNGDMRQGEVDVAILTSISAISFNSDTRSYEATISLVLTNKGSEPADDFLVAATMPSQIHVLEISDDRCYERDSNSSLGRLGAFVGASMSCQGLSLAESGNALGRDVEFIDIAVRITNIGELEDEIEFEIQGVDDDENLSDNTDRVRFTIGLDESGSVSDTLLALDALETAFSYEISSDALLDLQCDAYMNDVFDQLTILKQERPELFTNISFGRVTSGAYLITTGEALEFDPGSVDEGTIEGLVRSGSLGIINDPGIAGHVGVVVYLKGTDYRRTGVVIHGTPTWSPTDLDIETNRGRQGVGNHISSLAFAESIISFGTQGHGEYYRTPIQNFPGNPKQEQPGGCGFEGLYQDNIGEFNGGSTINCTGSVLDDFQTCNITPESIVLRSESPVDIFATNTLGASIRTVGSIILMDEYYDGRVFAWPEPHEDGSYSWLISLPDSEYDVELIGNGEGDYIFTSVTFDADGNTVLEETRSLTSPGLVDTFDVARESGEEGTGESSSSGGGGCTVGNSDHADPFILILALLSLVGIYRKRLFQMAWQITKG